MEDIPSDQQISLLISGIFVGINLLLSAFFSGTETAFTSLSPTQVEGLRHQSGRQGKIIAKLMDAPQSLLATVLVGNNLANVIAAVLASDITIRLFGSAALGVTTGVLTFAVLIFGEVAPKQFAVLHNEDWALRSAYAVRLFQILFHPLSWGATMIGALIIRFGGARRSTRITGEGILYLVNHAASLGILEQFKFRWVRNVLRFGETTAGAIMTHRTNIFSVSGSLTIAEAMTKLSAAGFARVPIYDTDPERIVGIVLLKDVTQALIEHREDCHLAELMLLPIFVPETRRIDHLLTQFRREQMNMAIVLDEYGGVLGLVTAEDIIEEIIGELYDEHDPIEQQKIKELSTGIYLIASDISIAEFNEQFNLNLPSRRGMNTLGGYLTDSTGSIPNLNDQIDTPIGQFSVHSMNSKRIFHVRYSKPVPDEEHPEPTTQASIV